MVVVPAAVLWSLAAAFVISASANVWAGFSFRKLGRQFTRLQQDQADYIASMRKGPREGDDAR